MRILMISDVYFPRVNGVSTSISVFRQAFRARGHDVTLVAPAYGDGPAEAGIERIRSRYLFIDPEDRVMRPGDIRRLKPKLQGGGFDIVHVQTPFVAHHAGVRLARELGVPVVETYHTYFEAYLHCYVPWLPTGWLRGLARRVTRRQCNAVDGVVAPSSAMAAALQSYGVTTPTTVLPTGIELDAFTEGDGDAFRRRLGIAPERPVLLYVGRVAHEKNIGFLLEVLQRVRQRQPQVLLLIAGEGPATANLQRRTRGMGLTGSVRFIGYLSLTGELQSCYRAADVFVFASRTETQGLVLLEAMALGVPVVSTAVMGTRDVLQADAGALVAADDVADFAAKTVRLLEDGALRRQLGQRGRTCVQRWTAGTLAQQMIDYYQQISDHAAHA